MNRFYVYQHRRADTGAIFYVGKGQGRRAYKKVDRTDAWRTAAANGYSVEFLIEGVDEDLAFLVEREAISVYRMRGIALVNISAGDTGCSGYKHTPEHIARLKGNRHGAASWGRTFKGKTHSEETKRLYSQMRAGKDNGKRKGTTRSLESRQKQSNARQGWQNIAARKLSVDQVREIRATLGYRQIASFARRYGVGESTIRRVRDGAYYVDAR